MHLTALVESADHVCCRYRLAAFRPYLAAAGHALDLRPLPRHWWSRLQLFRSLRGAAVVLQRRLLPAWQIAYLRRNVRSLLFDFDDAVFLRDSYAPRGLNDAGRLRRFTATVQSCDAVVAGNEFLRDAVLARAPATRVHVIPTCVDPELYPPAEPGQGRGPVKLVWIGSSSTLQGLERSAALLADIGASVSGIRLKLICDRSLALPGLPVDHCAWSEATEAADIASADIGISWVPDDDWSRGKCGLKILQYMAAGLPVVANPVGVHAEMVRPGETGFLAQTSAEWVAAVTRLAGDAGLRAQMGRAGRRLVETRYSVAAGAEQWLALLDSLRSSVAKRA
jgi:glycosyltransferase involved in cell wall biosynthesis